MSQQEDIDKTESKSLETSTVETSKIESSDTSSPASSSIKIQESSDFIENETYPPSPTHSILSIVTTERDTAIVEVPDIQSAVEIASSPLPSTTDEVRSKTSKKTNPSPVKGFISNIVQKFQSFSSPPTKEPVVEEYIAGQEFLDDSFIKIPTRHSSKKTQTSPVEGPPISKRAGRFLMLTEASEISQTENSSTSGTIDESELSKSSATKFDASKMSLTIKGAELPKCKTNLYERFKEIVRLSVQKKEEYGESCARTNASIATQTKENRKINTETTLQHQELAIGVNAAFQNLFKFDVPTKMKYSDSDATDISNDSSEPSTDFSASAKDETSDSSESKEAADESEITSSSKVCEPAEVETQKLKEEFGKSSSVGLKHEAVGDKDSSDVSSNTLEETNCSSSKLLPHSLCPLPNVPKASSSCNIDSGITSAQSPIIRECFENISDVMSSTEESAPSYVLRRGSEPENQSDASSIGGLKRKQSSSETLVESFESEQKETEKNPSKRPNNLDS